MLRYRARSQSEQLHDLADAKLAMPVKRGHHADAVLV